MIEVLIDAFVLTAIFAALAGTFIITIRAVNSGKVRVGAAAIANEQMERLRNLPYDSLSTENGTILPQGNILDTQTITKSSISYTVNISIIYVDDPFDGCAIPYGSGLYQCTDQATSSTQDVVPVDYKRITVEVSRIRENNILASLSSNASAKAAETASNTGMLLTIIQDAQGNPIEGATVTITNPSTGVSITVTSNAFGQVFVANVPPDNHNGYHLVVTKDGYSSDYTTSRTSQNPNQFQPDVDVNVQQVTSQTLVIDRLANMNVTVKTESGALASGVAITATSSKITQMNPDTAKNTYVVTTDGSGVASFSNIEWDSYTLSAPSGYSVLTTSPYQKIAVNPALVVPVNMVITTQSGWPLIESVNPTSSAATSVTILIEGQNFAGDTTVYLARSGFPSLMPASIDPASNGRSVEVVFNLAGASAGDWDIVVVSNSHTVTQLAGFTVL